jgi:hypothetical protein
MKNLLLLLLLIFALASPELKAQLDSSKAQKLIEKNFIVPSLRVEDIKYIQNKLCSMELAPSEVKVFLECKNALQYILDAVEKGGAKDDEVIQAELNINTAQNIINFLSTMKIKAVNAENFQRFLDALQEANDELNKFRPAQ